MSKKVKKRTGGGHIYDFFEFRVHPQGILILGFACKKSQYEPHLGVFIGSGWARVGLKHFRPKPINLVIGPGQVGLAGLFYYLFRFFFFSFLE